MHDSLIVVKHVSYWLGILIDPALRFELYVSPHFAVCESGLVRTDTLGQGHCLTRSERVRTH